MDVEAVIKALFDDDKDIAQVSPHIEGLGIVKQWLTDAEQTSLLAAIERERWLATSNQAMCFGSLPDWALSLGEAASQLLHSNGWVQDAEVWGRQPLFNQLILNRYDPGEGIPPHLDLARFQDGIAVVSLGGPALMNFTPAQPQDLVTFLESEAHASQLPQQPLPAGPECIQVLLEGGDLLLLHGPARYHWRHGIDAVPREVERATGRNVVRSLRVSVTLRKLSGILLTEPAD